MNEGNNLLLLFSTLGASALCVVIAVLHHHFVNQFYIRQRLLNQISSLRLSRMLNTLGIPLKTYLRKTPWEEVGQQIVACKHCQELRRCDQCLKNGRCELGMGFCPNFISFAKLRK